MVNIKILNEVPPYSGLYLIGSVYLNPRTNKPLYFVKVGQSKNLEKRVNQYYTYNPFFKFIDFVLVDSKKLLKEEKSYHELLSQKCKWGTGEWFVVEEKAYFNLVEYGFSILNFTF